MNFRDRAIPEALDCHKILGKRCSATAERALLNVLPGVAAFMRTEDAGLTPSKRRSLLRNSYMPELRCIAVPSELSAFGETVRITAQNETWEVLPFGVFIFADRTSPHIFRQVFNVFYHSTKTDLSRWEKFRIDHLPGHEIARLINLQTALDVQILPKAVAEELVNRHSRMLTVPRERLRDFFGTLQMEVLEDDGRTSVYDIRRTNHEKHRLHLATFIPSGFTRVLGRRIL